MFAVEPGKRPNTNVFYSPDGYAYHLNRVKVNDECTTVYLRCALLHGTNCHATAVLKCHGAEEEWILGHRGQNARWNARHVCIRDFGIWEERRLRNEILEACGNNPYRNPQDLLNRIACRYDLEVSSRVRIASFRYAMRRSRLSRYPPIPASVPELGALLGDYTYRNITATEDYDDNIYSATVGPPGHQSLVFVSTRMLHCLRRTKIIFADATFKSAPGTPANRQVIPIVQALMQSKSYEAYYAIVQHLKRIAPNFIPRDAVMDFEDAQFQAWKTAFPDLTITGCYVHFVRAYRGHLGTMGLIRIMNRVPVAKQLLRCVVGIPLLPAELLLRGLGVLRRKAQESLDRPEFGNMYQRILGALQYVEATWLTGWRAEIVCVHGRAHRTNNACESANRILAAEVSVRHPNAWVFIEGLRRLEQGSYTDYYAFATGRRIGQRRRVTVVMNDIVIQNLTTDLLQGQMSIFGFLRRISMRVANLIPDLRP